MTSKGVATYQELLQQTRRILVQDGRFPSLGGWGDYIIVCIQPALINQPSQIDFVILDNTFIGNAELGIIYVS